MLAERAAGCDQDHPRSSLKRDQLFLRNLSRRAKINATGLIHAGQVRLRFGELAQVSGQRFVITRRFLAHEHEIDLQATQIPEGMRSQNFAHDFDVAEVTDHDDDNRQVAGNALPPERALTLGPAPQTRGRRSQLGLRKDNEGRQLLKDLHIAGADVEPAHLQLGMGPCCLKSACASVKLCVALGQSDNRFARLRHHGDERKLKSLVRQDRDAPAQAEDRIEHGPDPIR